MLRQWWFPVLVAIYLLLNLTHAVFLGKTVYGDGIFYYSWVRSLIIDHDLDFTNDLTHFQATSPTLPSGKPANKYSLGPALFWLPAFTWIHYLVGGDGFGFPYQLAVSVSSTLGALTGLMLLYRWLKRFFSEFTSILTTCGIALSTNLLFYGAIDSVNSHAISFLAATFFLNLLFATRPNWLLVEASLGFIFLTRAQDAVLTILILPFLRQIKFPKLLLGLILIASGQIIIWKIIHGSFTNPYFLYGEKFDWTDPQIFSVLFSKNNGLFLWSPILLISTLGVFLIKNIKLKVIFVALLFTQLYIVASWQIWWQGASFSGRMFVGWLPIFAFGLATLIDRFRSFLNLEKALLIFFSLVNFTAISYFLFQQ